MKYYKSKCVFLSLLILYVSIQIHSQSRYLEGGIGGSCFQINTAFNTDKFISAGISAAYSIGGIMDIGFQLSRETGAILTYERTDWNFDFLYNVIVLKQSEYIPISLQLEGTYGYTNISSEYLENLQFTREAQGFEVGISLFREFNRRGLFSVLLGAKATYRNYLLTEMNNQDPSTPVINFTERVERFIWGGIAAFTIKPDKWPYFTLEVEIFYNQTEGGFLFVPSFLITTPTI